MILYVLFLISSIESSDSFCSIEYCQQNSIHIDDIIATLNDLTERVVNLEHKNAELEADVSRLESENDLLKADVTEIQVKVGLEKLPPV